MDQVVAIAIFVVSLGLIFAEWLHRVIVAVAGALAMVVAGLALGFYSEEQMLESVDFTTILLLLGMMTVVALFEPTGFFEYLALRAGRLSGGKPFLLFLLLGAVTSVLSMFLDNVTTVVVIAPVTLVIAKVLGLPAAPLLMAEAMLSNVGGVATLVGDPPNILIGSAADLSFVDFLTHALPTVAVAWVAATGLLWLLLRGELHADKSDQHDVAALHPREALKQPRQARMLLVVLAVAGVLFLLQEVLGLDAAIIALGAAGLALLLVRPDVEATFERVEWTVLIFFAALFVMVGGLEASGALQHVADALAGLEALDPVVLGLIIIWSVAALSAVIDNVPITIVVIPVISGLGAAGVDIEPLWWALAFGAGFGGNATVIGATANIVVVTQADRAGQPISSRRWVRAGLPVTVLTCAVASVGYVIGATFFWV